MDIDIFEKNKKKFLILKDKYNKKILTKDQLIKAQKELIVLDKFKNYWMPGLNSGDWYVFKDNEWIKDDPFLFFNKKQNIKKNKLFEDKKIIYKQLFYNFLIGLFIALWGFKEQWSASQMMWQFWTSSFLFGLLFLFLGMIIGTKNKTVKKKKRNYLYIFIGAILFSIILVMPITFFHFLYALFLNHLFPILDWDPMGKHLSLIFDFNFEILVKCVSMSWMFLIGVFLSKINDLIKLYKFGNINILIDPFKSILQMHVLIIIFGFFSTLKLSSNYLYLVLIFGYFITSDLLRLRKFHLIAKKNNIETEKKV